MTPGVLFIHNIEISNGVLRVNAKRSDNHVAEPKSFTVNNDSHVSSCNFLLFSAPIVSSVGLRFRQPKRFELENSDPGSKKTSSFRAKISEGEKIEREYSIQLQPQ